MRYNLLSPPVSAKLVLPLTLLLLSVLINFKSATAQQTFSPDEQALRKQMELDGASLPVIDRVIQQRRLQKQINILPPSNQHTVLNASCADMGGENGWGDWLGAEGSCATGFNVYPPATNPPLSPFFALTSGLGIDPCSNTPGSPTISYVAPGFGLSSLRLGEPQMPGYGAERATFSFFVNPGDTDFTYMYAIVIEDAGHSPAEQPYVSLCIRDANGASLPCGCFTYTGGPNMPGFTQSPCGINTYYKPWTVVGVDLSPYVGQTLTVEIENVDCKQGGHYAYSYWDFTCGSLLTDAGYFCTGQSSNICVPPDPSNLATYLWHKNGLPYAGLPNATSPCINPVPQVGDTFTVTVHPPSGCDFDLSYVPHPFEVYPNLIDFPHCTNVDFLDMSTTSTSAMPLDQWQWNFPTGTPQTINGQYPGTINFPPGEHTVTLIVASNGCYDTIQHTFTVNDPPVADFIASDVCFGTPVEFTDHSVATPGDSVRRYTWLFPTGNPTMAANHIAHTTFNAAGEQSTTLIIETMNGCIDTIVKPVHVHEFPTAQFDTPQEGCAPFSMTVANTTLAMSDSISSWLWTFPGGSPEYSREKNPPPILYTKPGTYYAFLYAESEYGCSSQLLRDSFVTVHSTPSVDFTTSQNEATLSTPEFTFKHQWSDDVTGWKWNFGDGLEDSLTTDPLHSYTLTTIDNDFYTFDVSLYVVNSFGCSDIQTNKVKVLPETAFFIPNTFTPNSDDMNDLFFGKSYGVKEYEIAIYDRWGVLVWECQQAGSNVPFDKNSNEGMASSCKWDGKIGGMESSQNDTYVYKIHMVDIYDRAKNYIGEVNLIH